MSPIDGCIGNGYSLDRWLFIETFISERKVYFRDRIVGKQRLPSTILCFRSIARDRNRAGVVNYDR